MKARVGAAVLVASFALAAIVAVFVARSGGSDTVEGVRVTGAWARPTPSGADEAVVYLRAESGADDALVGVDVPASIAHGASLHTSDAAGGHAHHGGAASGEASAAVTMQSLEYIALPARKAVVFEPGGNHLMLSGLSAPLTRGQHFTLTLRLAQAAPVAVEVTVQDNAPG